MSWRKTILLGLVFGVSGLAYAAWATRRKRLDAETRRRIAELDAAGERWCTCSGEYECEGHRA
jgi:hypothetical protein